MDLPQLGATHASPVPENIAGVSRIHAPRAIAGAATLRHPHRRRPAIDVSPSV
jgi:hypothetical protein